LKSSTSANLVIIQLLHTSSDHTDFLRLCWDQLSAQQKKQIFHFLYLSQQYKTFINILRQEMLSEHPTIPWTHVFALLHRWKKLNKYNLKSLVNLDSPTDDMTEFRVDFPELNEIWQKKKQKKLAEYENKKQSLLKELDFAKNQGLKEKRVQAIDQLKKFFPNDKAIASVSLAEKEFQARNAYNRLLSKKTRSISHKKEAPEISPEELEQTIKTIKKYLKKNADYAYDFSLMFMQMDVPLYGLMVIDLLKKKSQKLLWYELQLCLNGKQYARALSTIDLLQKTKITSEHSFSLLYYQAVALYGLGKKSSAIQIIKNILKIRPQFKSASSLLLEWESES
jgi:tetratricopeptide (TPR) repeat protein